MPSVALRALRLRSEIPPFNQEALDRLLELHARFAERRPNGRRAMIHYLQLQGLDLSRKNLAEADLTGVNLERSRLIGANFERASLYCADMRSADARQANFRRADIRGASLRHANLSGANLDDADMRQAMLARTDLVGGLKLTGASANQGQARDDIPFSVDFTNCSMKGARLNNAKLKGANFTGAVLHGASLKGANLLGARFSGAVLTGVDLNGVHVDEGALSDCVLDPTEQARARAPVLMQRLEAARLWIASDGRQGGPALLDGEDLRPLAGAFAGMALTALSAKQCCAIGLDFTGAQLQGAHFDGADLRDANFTGADLRGASFRNAILWHARFDDANTSPLPLARGGVREIDLAGAAYQPGCFGRR